MTEQTTFDWNSVVEEQSNDERTFINFDGDSKEAVLTCIFEENYPFHTGKDNFNNDRFMFKVEDLEGNKRIFSTSSKRCMRGIRENTPLDGKCLRITRTGLSFDTMYTVEEI